jgi:hypothetical protein
MWRITLCILLLCSLAINVYLFLQLNIQVINNKISPYQSAVSNTESSPQPINSTVKYNEQPLSVKVKRALQERDYFLASFLIKSLPNKKQLPELKAYWLKKNQDTN